MRQQIHLGSAGSAQHRLDQVIEVLRGLLEVSCTASDLAYKFGVQERIEKDKPFLDTLLRLVNVPRKEEIPVPFKTESGTCENLEEDE